jgi:hypothetical protein
MERVAAQKTPGREHGAAAEAVTGYRLPRVDRAGWLEPAGPRQERRDEPLVETEDRDGAPCARVHRCGSRASARVTPAA